MPAYQCNGCNSAILRTLEFRNCLPVACGPADRLLGHFVSGVDHSWVYYCRLAAKLLRLLSLLGGCGRGVREREAVQTKDCADGRIHMCRERVIAGPDQKVCRVVRRSMGRSSALQNAEFSVEQGAQQSDGCCNINV